MAIVSPFWVKNGKCLEPSRMCSFKVKRNQKRRRRNFERSTKWVSRMFDIQFWPKDSFRFSINIYKILNFIVTENGICAIKLLRNNTHKFQLQSIFLIFGCRFSINIYKIINFIVTEYGICAIKLLRNNTHKFQFQSIFLIFDCAMAKMVKMMT